MLAVQYVAIPCMIEDEKDGAASISVHIKDDLFCYSSLNKYSKGHINSVVGAEAEFYIK
jgi:hypothetical protein